MIKGALIARAEKLQTIMTLALIIDKILRYQAMISEASMCLLHMQHILLRESSKVYYTNVLCENI
jgi:hypothetical protein